MFVARVATRHGSNGSYKGQSRSSVDRARSHGSYTEGKWLLADSIRCIQVAKVGQHGIGQELCALAAEPIQTHALLCV